MEQKKKPTAVKCILGLNIFKLILSLTLFTVFTIKDITVGAVSPDIILYTFLAYAALSIPIFIFANKRQVIGLRVALALDFLVSIPATAVAGFVISIVSLLITFGKAAKSYFNA